MHEKTREAPLAQGLVRFEHARPAAQFVEQKRTDVLGRI
jgi:hypothetical protein